MQAASQKPKGKTHAWLPTLEEITFALKSLGSKEAIRVFKLLTSKWDNLPPGVQKRDFVNRKVPSEEIEISMRRAIRRVSLSCKKFPLLASAIIALPLLREGCLFHEGWANKKRRKYKNEHHAEHDRRVTERTLEFYTNLGRGTPPAKIILGWILHDAIEDYGLKAPTLERALGKDISENVERFTTPKNLPDFYDDEEFATKMEKKFAYKRENIQYYTVSDALFKFFDNIDALKSYAEDIRQGYNRVTTDLRKVDNSTGVVAEQFLQENMSHRKEINECLIKRCQKLKEEGLLTSNELAIITREFAARFEEVAKNLNSAIDNNLNSPPAPPYIGQEQLAWRAFGVGIRRPFF